MVRISDSSILDLLERDKDEGIKLLFDKYYLSLVIYAEQILKDRGVSEDLVQDLFVKLWSQNYLENIEENKLKQYLHRSVKNSSLSYLHKSDSLRNPIDLQQIQIAENAIKHIDEAIIQQVFKEVYNLSGRTQEVVVKVMLEGKKYQEVANEMSISINTVKFHLKEGLKKLRGRLLNSDNLYFILISLSAIKTYF